MTVLYCLISSDFIQMSTADTHMSVKSLKPNLSRAHFMHFCSKFVCGFGGSFESRRLSEVASGIPLLASLFICIRLWECFPKKTGIFPSKLLLNEGFGVVLAFCEHLSVVVIFVKHKFWMIVTWQKGWINIWLNIWAAWGWMRMAGSPWKVAKGHHVHGLDFALGLESMNYFFGKHVFLLRFFHMNISYSV